MGKRGCRFGKVYSDWIWMLVPLPKRNPVTSIQIPNSGVHVTLLNDFF